MPVVLVFLVEMDATSAQDLPTTARAASVLSCCRAALVRLPAIMASLLLGQFVRDAQLGASGVLKT